MKITTKKPLRPRGRSDEKRQSTKDAIRDAYANGPQREVQIIPAKKDLAAGKEQRKLRVCAYCRVSTEEDNQATMNYRHKQQGMLKQLRVSFNRTLNPLRLDANIPLRNRCAAML